MTDDEFDKWGLALFGAVVCAVILGIWAIVFVHWPALTTALTLGIIGGTIIIKKFFDMEEGGN